MSNIIPLLLIHAKAVLLHYHIVKIVQILVLVMFALLDIHFIMDSALFAILIIVTNVILQLLVHRIRPVVYVSLLIQNLQMENHVIK